MPLPTGSNPFIALGVATRELSYSQVIAKQALTIPSVLQALVDQVRPDWGPVALHSPPKTEHSLGEAGRVDILALLKNPGEHRPSKVLVVETKFNAHQGVAQLRRYRDALMEGSAALGVESLPNESVVVVGLKLVPADWSLLEAETAAQETGLALMKAGDFSRCLGEHNPLGLGDMLHFLVEAEVALQRDPIAVATQPGALNQLIRDLMPAAVDEFKFIGFQRAVAARGGADGPRHAGGVHVTRGGGLTQYFEAGWQPADKLCQVHFELKGYGNMALHVEVNPHTNKPSPEQLAAKNQLLELLRERFEPQSIPGWKILNRRKDWEHHASSTLGVLDIDWEDLDASADRFVLLYAALKAHLTHQLPPQQWP